LVEAKRQEKHYTAFHSSFRSSAIPPSYTNNLSLVASFLSWLLVSQIRPNRASIMQFGYDSLLNRIDHSQDIVEETSRELVFYISKFFRRLCDIQGHHWFFWPIQGLGVFGEIAFCILDIQRSGLNTINGSACLAALLKTPELLFMTWVGAYGKVAMPIEKDLEDGSISHYISLSLKGLDILAAAQERNADETGKPIPPSSFIRVLKDMIKHRVMLECIFIHFTIGFLPLGLAVFPTLYRNQDSDLLKKVLKVLLAWSWIVSLVTNCGMSYCVRLMQKLQEFEIRRLQCDIRTCQYSLIHRAAPRFKALPHDRKQSSRLFLFYITGHTGVILSIHRRSFHCRIWRREAIQRRRRRFNREWLRSVLGLLRFRPACYQRHHLDSRFRTVKSRYRKRRRPR